jgi:pyridoxamine 5'-phosphate oxidase
MACVSNPSTESGMEPHLKANVASLDETTVNPDPIVQFTRWFDDATRAGIAEPNAMALATADASGAPSVRTVLLKSFDQRGFVFYTNYQSRKGRDLAANPRASLCLYWQPLERQVRIDGTVERVSRAESEAYFHTRPIGSQIGATISPQSEPIASRDELDRRFSELAEQCRETAKIPLPPFWGGYRVIPTTIEFWQGRASRLHDRLLYTRDAAGRWTIQRLAP